MGTELPLPVRLYAVKHCMFMFPNATMYRLCSCTKLYSVSCHWQRAPVIGFGWLVQFAVVLNCFLLYLIPVSHRVCISSF